MKKQGYNARLDESLGERNRKKKSRSKTKRTKGGRALSPTAINLNMGEPKTKTITARGMGAAIRGGQFREVV
jgi:hypothetical protein